MESSSSSSSLPEEILQPLLTAASKSSSSSLEQSLQSLIELSRTSSGRSDLASKSILPPLLHLIHHHHHLLILTLKLLKNLCAGEISNQNAFIHQNGVGIISDLFNRALKDNPDVEVVRLGLQVLANVALAGEMQQREIWLRCFPERFLEIAKVRRKETCDPLCKVVYVCCDGCGEIAAKELCGDGGFSLTAEIVRTASFAGFGEDWFKLLLSRICVENVYFLRLFDMLYRIGKPGDVEDSASLKDASFSSEQAFLLSIVSEIVNERINEVSVPKDTALFILGVFKRSVEVVDFVSGGKSELPTGITNVDVMGYSLTILRDTCTGESLEELKEEDSNNVVDGLLSSGLIGLLLGLLRVLEPPTIIRKALKQSDNQEGDSSGAASKPCPYKGFRRDIVAVIGNCAYRRKRVQDEIRERDGILLMLQQCVTDEDNPFLREWGIWCMRNLLEGNEENQRAVADLEVKGSVDLPELARLGLRVEVDPKTRRPKLVNIP